MPSPALPDGVWAKQLEEEIGHARAVLVELRDKVRGGRTLGEIAAEQEAEEAAVTERVLDRVMNALGERRR
jgi:hypothetical protein